MENSIDFLGLPIFPEGYETQEEGMIGLFDAWNSHLDGDDLQLAQDMQNLGLSLFVSAPVADYLTGRRQTFEILEGPLAIPVPKFENWSWLDVADVGLTAVSYLFPPTAGLRSLISIPTKATRIVSSVNKTIFQETLELAAKARSNDVDAIKIFEQKLRGFITKNALSHETIKHLLKDDKNLSNSALKISSDGGTLPENVVNFLVKRIKLELNSTTDAASGLMGEITKREVSRSVKDATKILKQAGQNSDDLGKLIKDGKLDPATLRTIKEWTGIKVDDLKAGKEIDSQLKLFFQPKSSSTGYQQLVERGVHALQNRTEAEINKTQLGQYVSARLGRYLDNHPLGKTTLSLLKEMGDKVTIHLGQTVAPSVGEGMIVNVVDQSVENIIGGEKPYWDLDWSEALRAGMVAGMWSVLSGSAHKGEGITNEIGASLAVGNIGLKVTSPDTPRERAVPSVFAGSLFGAGWERVSKIFKGRGIAGTVADKALSELASKGISKAVYFLTSSEPKQNAKIPKFKLLITDRNGKVIDSHGITSIIKDGQVQLNFEHADSAPNLQKSMRMDYSFTLRRKTT